VDSSCAQHDWAKCLCQKGSTPSPDFEHKKDDMEANEYNYFQCYERAQEKKTTNASMCSSIGLDAAAFLPEKVPYPDGPTCASFQDNAYLTYVWSWCCCGVESACCPYGLATCEFYDNYQSSDVWKENVACPNDFDGPVNANGSCFFASDARETFVDCEEQVCEPLGGTLASVRSQAEYDYLARILDGRVAFLGGFQDESGEWLWVDGADFSAWAPGQPDAVCENCLALAPSKVNGWFDTSCAQTLACVCRAGGEPGSRYLTNRAILKDDCADDVPSGDESSSPEKRPISHAEEAYCLAYGFEPATFAPNLRAYPSTTTTTTEEGLCGFVVADNDGTWARCCCDDEAYCCAEAGDLDCKSNNVCPEGYASSGAADACFRVSDEQSTFVGCQERVCGPEGSALASLRTDADFDLVGKLLEEGGVVAFVGLFHAHDGADWQWVDGSSGGARDWWVYGEPNDECGVCAAVAPGWASGALVDASCNALLRCVCRYDAATSSQYAAAVPYLQSDDLCDDDEVTREQDVVASRLATIQAELLALLVLVSCVVVAGLAGLVVAARPYFRALRTLRKTNNIPAYGLELGPAYDSLILDSADHVHDYNPRGAVLSS